MCARLNQRSIGSEVTVAIMPESAIILRSGVYRNAVPQPETELGSESKRHLLAEQAPRTASAATG
jgi:hypothetical protein